MAAARTLDTAASDGLKSEPLSQEAQKMATDS